MELTLQPKVLQWARKRASLEVVALAQKLKVSAADVTAWEETGVLRFTQAKKLAHVTYTPEGFLFLAEPPDDRLPIPDFRAISGAPLRHPSPDLLETVQTMQQRQAWMRDFLIEEGESELPFVGSRTTRDRIEDVAADMRKTLGFADGWADQEPTWAAALQHLREKIEEAGILIVVNGVVGNNTHRKLDPDEFRGFALCDSFAPLVFINGCDFKGAQMFTFGHELAHLWIGQEGVSNVEVTKRPTSEIESFCDRVAAEFLVPGQALKDCWREAQQQAEPYQFLACRFKVSSIVAARRALDMKLATYEDFLEFYRLYKDDERRKRVSRSDGGNFWNTQNVRVGSYFGEAVVRAAKEGRLLYRQAYQLTGLSGTTFDSFAKQLGFRMG